MRKIFSSIIEKKRRTLINKDEFLTEAQHFPRTTPLQIDILFAMTRLLHSPNERSTDSIRFEDFDLISNNEHLLPYRLRSEIVEENYKVEHQSLTMKLLESCYRFSLGKTLKFRISS